MKRTKLDYLESFWKDLFSHLGSHKWQGRIIAIGVSLSMIIWSIRFCDESLSKLISLIG